MLDVVYHHTHDGHLILLIISIETVFWASIGINSMAVFYLDYSSFK